MRIRFDFTTEAARLQSMGVRAHTNEVRTPQHSERVCLYPCFLGASGPSGDQATGGPFEDLVDKAVVAKQKSERPLGETDAPHSRRECVVCKQLLRHHKDYSIWLTTYGRKTGKPRIVQIWFAYVNNRFYVLSRHGLKSWWAKNLLKNSRVIVNLGGLGIEGEGHLEDQSIADQIWRYYRAKYMFYPQILFPWGKRKLFRMDLNHNSDFFDER